MQDPNDLQQQILQQHDALQQQREALQQLQQAKLEALQQVLGNYGDFRYVDLDDFLDPNNQNWNDYSYKISSPLVGLKGRVGAGTPIGMLIQQVRDAKNIDDVKKQLEVWNSYKPLDSSDNGTSYVRYFIPGFGAYRNTPSIGSRPVQTIAGGTGIGGTQGGVAGGSTQGAQAGNTGGGTPSTQGVQGVQTGNSGGTAGGTSGIASTKGIQTGGTSGTYASFGVPKGGTKTIGYENEQERRAALIDKWNQEHGISYNTGKDGVIYRIDPQHPKGYADPFKNDLATWTRATKAGSTYASPGISTGGTYATGEGIKDANGNVLTNPGGDWEYQYALKNPQYGLGMMSKMSDAQKNYLQAVSDNMGYKYNFTGANRFV